MSRGRSAISGAAALTVLLLFGTAAAAAPSDFESTLQRCADTESAEARIRCLEAALADLHGVVAGDSGSPPNAPIAPSTLGAEQVDARERTSRDVSQERMRARITNHRIVGYRTLQVGLDNGQIWRQLSADTQRLKLPRDRELTAEVWPTRFGGYQLRIEELRRTIRVERVR